MADPIVLTQINKCRISNDDTLANAKDIKDNVQSITINHTRGMWDVTSLADPYKARRPLKGDTSVTLNGFVDTATDKAHDQLKDTSSVKYLDFAGTGGANDLTYSGKVVQTSYNVPIGQEGEVPFDAEFMNAGGTNPIS